MTDVATSINLVNISTVLEKRDRKSDPAQADLVGPCYLTGPIRLYSLSAVDAAIKRCGIEPMSSRAVRSLLDIVYALSLRMRIPENLQVDNKLAFYGNPTHARGMGPLIRLCLRYGINSGSFTLPSRGGTESSKNSTTITSRSFSTMSPGRP